MNNKILLGLSVLVFTPIAFADVKIRNGSKYDITEIYLSPESISTWGADQLDDEVLEPKDTLTLSDVDPGTWDFKIVFREVGGEEDYNCVIPAVELGETGDDSTFDSKTLDKCWENTDEDE